MGKLTHTKTIDCECEPKVLWMGYADIAGTEEMWTVIHVEWPELTGITLMGFYPEIEVVQTTNFIIPVKDMAEAEAMIAVQKEQDKPLC